jgi:hypothetical protein
MAPLQRSRQRLRTEARYRLLFVGQVMSLIGD